MKPRLTKNYDNNYDNNNYNNNKIAVSSTGGVDDRSHTMTNDSKHFIC
jgi:hypothetical protein